MNNNPVSVSDIQSALADLEAERIRDGLGSEPTSGQELLDRITGADQ